MTGSVRMTRNKHTEISLLILTKSILEDDVQTPNIYNLALSLKAFFIDFQPRE